MGDYGELRRMQERKGLAIRQGDWSYVRYITSAIREYRRVLGLNPYRDDIPEDGE